MNLSTIAKGLRLIADGLEDKPKANAQATKDTPVAETAPATLPMYQQDTIAPVNQPVSAAHTQSKAVTREDVISAFTQLFQAKGQDVVIGLLRDHGLKRISEASETQLADLYAAAVGEANV